MSPFWTTFRAWVEAAFVLAIIAAIVWGLWWCAHHPAKEKPPVLVKCPACGEDIEVELKKRGGE
jgi:hypothetical protein